MYGIMITALVERAGFCGELRALTLPSENPSYNQQRTASDQSQKKTVDPSVYKEFEQKIKDISPAALTNAIASFTQRREQAIKNRSLDEVEYYSKLLDLLNKKGAKQ
jgi:hypothetical protein